mmetsp:Transcript_39110/g.93884  ORF Transcript_39110/g.93884 Transcript_39110/m.93884 type:complete len:281 (-) Transcript_39110:369-1211(-)
MDAKAIDARVVGMTPIGLEHKGHRRHRAGRVGGEHLHLGPIAVIRTASLFRDCVRSARSVPSHDLKMLWLRASLAKLFLDVVHSNRRHHSRIPQVYSDVADHWKSEAPPWSQVLVKDHLGRQPISVVDGAQHPAPASAATRHTSGGLGKINAPSQGCECPVNLSGAVGNDVVHGSLEPRHASSHVSPSSSRPGGSHHICDCWTRLQRGNAPLQSGQLGSHFRGSMLPSLGCLCHLILDRLFHHATCDSLSLLQLRAELPDSGLQLCIGQLQFHQSSVHCC